MTRKQKRRHNKVQLREMLETVDRGHVFRICDQDGHPQAIVLPWKDWQAMNRKLIEAEVRDKVPESAMAQVNT